MEGPKDGVGEKNLVGIGEGVGLGDAGDGTVNVLLGCGGRVRTEVGLVQPARIKKRKNSIGAVQKEAFWTAPLLAIFFVTWLDAGFKGK
jgi:hypothetical protein